MKTIFIFVFALFCSFITYAQKSYSPIEKNIINLYDREEYAEAFNIAIDEAMNGNAFAQTIIGKMYNEGYVVEHNDKEALKWFKKAAAQGNEEAMFKIGVLYYYGKDNYPYIEEGTEDTYVEEDKDEAYKWIKQSAEKGFAEAQVYLGNFFFFGEGVFQKNLNEANKWYEKAAAQGSEWVKMIYGNIYFHDGNIELDDDDYKVAYRWTKKAYDLGCKDAVFLLGRMNERGQGVPQNITEAIKWYKKGAENDNWQCESDLGDIYANGKGVPVNKSEAEKWYKKVAEKGYRVTDLAKLYYDWDEKPGNKQEALKWFQKAAENGNADAQLHMAYAYLDGENVSQNNEEALKWFQKAAEQDNINAIMQLALRYYAGLGTKYDLSKSFYWFQKAEELGEIDALSYLGKFYQNGIVVDRDEKKAFSLYKKSAENGDAYGAVDLALCYLYGIGTSPNSDTALFWMQKAKNEGNETAGEMIEVMKEAYKNYYGSQKDYTYISQGNTITILMEKRNNIYYLPCKINGISADFVFDTGAGAISISAGFANELTRRGLLSNSDILGKGKSILADGRQVDATIVNIKDVEIGGMHLKDVAAVVKEQLNAPLLLGQTAIEKLGSITIDGCKLIIQRR